MAARLAVAYGIAGHSEMFDRKFQHAHAKPWAWHPCHAVLVVHHFGFFGLGQVVGFVLEFLYELLDVFLG